jgi:hypothetical protein
MACGGSVCSQLGNYNSAFSLNRLRKTEETRCPVRVSNGVPLEDELKELHLAPLAGCNFCHSARQGHCNQPNTLHAPSPKSCDKKRNHYQCMVPILQTHQRHLRYALSGYSKLILFLHDGTKWSHSECRLRTQQTCERARGGGGRGGGL